MCNKEEEQEREEREEEEQKERNKTRKNRTRRNRRRGGGGTAMLLLKLHERDTQCLLLSQRGGQLRSQNPCLGTKTVRMGGGKGGGDRVLCRICPPHRQGVSLLCVYVCVLRIVHATCCVFAKFCACCVAYACRRRSSSSYVCEWRVM